MDTPKKDIKFSTEVEDFGLDSFDSTEPKSIDAESLKQSVAGFRKIAEDKRDALSSMNRHAATILQLQEKAKDIVIPEENESNLTLGEILLRRGLVSRDQLDIALKEQRESTIKKELGTILVELNFINDQILSQILSETSGVSSMDLKAMALDAEIIKKIPKNIASQYKIIAVKFENNELQIATPDVYNVIAIDQIKRYFGKNIRVKPFFANDIQITQVIDQYYDYEMDMNAIIKEIETGEIVLTGLEGGYVNPTVRFVDSILMHAVKINASDIHLEPEAEFVRLRYRIDGRLMQVLSFHKQYWSAILVRLKIISQLNIAETRNPQDGRITLNVTGRKVDFRISSMPTIQGENIVARVLDKSKSLVPLEDLGLNQYNLQLIRRMLKRPEGIVIVTGPTGSGKSTTLYSLLSHINSMDINIMTLEDPVEYQLPIIRQSQVRDDGELNFETGIRTMMRQDPDIIFVGEARDQATASMSVRAAMTGHRVFTTLHTNDAMGAVPRLLDLGIKGSLLSGNMVCTIAQRLARRLCNYCRIKKIASLEECKVLRVDPINPPTIYEHRGCVKCFNTGYKGRVAIFEILPIDLEMDELIFREASRKEMLEHAATIGYRNMSEDIVEKILDGVTDIEEAVDTVDMTERLKDVNIFV